MNLNNSKTKENLMRSFAGESQARNRYTFAADAAKKENYQIISDLFTYTANQERAHAWQFMQALKEFSKEDINFAAGYPVEVETSTLTLLKEAQKHEDKEATVVYPDFAKIAKEEGFPQIAQLFTMVASIEKTHSERFAKYASDLENNTLFSKNEAVQWMCTNCGYIYEGKEAPKICPVCEYSQDYYILFSDSSFE